MRTRSFIGLIVLVAALIVAATPQLLEPTARGIERLSVKAGLLPDREKELEKLRKNDASQTKDPVTSRLDLKGYTLQKNGDLVDSVATNRRAFEQDGRLRSGKSRATLPGELSRSDRWNGPLVTDPDGMILDSTSCPIFRNDTEIARILGDKELMQSYVDKAGKADDGVACQKVVRAELKRVDDLRLRLPGDRRNLESNLRGDSEQIVLDAYRIGVFGLLFDGVDSGELADETRAALNTTR